MYCGSKVSCKFFLIFLSKFVYYFSKSFFVTFRVGIFFPYFNKIIDFNYSGSAVGEDLYVFFPQTDCLFRHERKTIVWKSENCRSETQTNRCDLRGVLSCNAYIVN